MKIGKLSETVLIRSVFKVIRHRRNEVLMRPGVGLDCTQLKFEEDDVIVLSTDPITGAVHDIGKLAVNITANDIASNGAEPVGIMLTVLLPPKISELKFKKMMQEMEYECASLNIEILGGHTEVTNVVNKPLISVTGVGKIKKDKRLKPSDIKPGYDIVMTKYAGLEGTAIIAKTMEDELSEKYPKELIESAKNLMSDISVVKDSLAAMKGNVVFMHDITEGGVFGACWEMAEAAGLGLKVDLRKIPIKQETIEICDFFDINPYMLISSGCMLMAAPNGNRLVEVLQEEGVPASVIGLFTDNNDKIVINQDETRYLEPPASDELYKVMGVGQP